MDEYLDEENVEIVGEYDELGYPVSSKKKISKKKATKVAKPKPVTYTTNAPPTSKKVEIENAFGWIKMKIADSIITEDVCVLIFQHEDDVTFKPKTGEQYTITVNGVTYPVVYADIFLDGWIPINTLWF